MKKDKLKPVVSEVEPEMKEEYSREELGTGVRGKYYPRKGSASGGESYRNGTNVVLLDPDIAKVFPTQES